MAASAPELGPLHRLVTLPQQIPALTLGWEAVRWASKYLRQPNGPRAGQRFEFTDSQLRFLLHFYAVDSDGAWLYRRAIRRLAKGSGKAEILSAVIPTPSGWTTVGEIKPGDALFGADGTVIRCIQVHPVLHGEDTYQVMLSDGTSSEFSAEHLFDVDVFIGGRKRVRKTLSVAEMAEQGVSYPRPLTTGRTKCVTGGVARFTMPGNPVLDLPFVDLPIDPYVLGTWLGDGDSDCPRITVGAADLPHLLVRLDACGVEHGEPTRTDTAFRVRFGRGWAKVALRDLGLLGNKHIPTSYLRADVGQRRALLQGLMDSDGSIGATGSAEFCVTNLALASGTAELIRTLGMKVRVRESDAKIDGRVVSKRYRLVFKPHADEPVFTLPRKVERLRTRTYSSAPRTIRSIDLVESRPMRCITVSATDGLYLSGETMWVTHNSPFAALMALVELCAPVRLDGFDPRLDGGCKGRPVSMPLVQISATAEAQTKNTMRMVRAFAPKGSRVVADHGLDPGLTQYYMAGGGHLEVITSSMRTAEGSEATFIVADEVEHWVPGNGGPGLASTLADNLAKSGSRMLETCNAWQPGAESVAEASFDAWVAQEEGRTRGETAILYDARVAPPETDLRDPESLTAALDFVYHDCWWVERDPIRERIWDLQATESDSRRKYLNQPIADEQAWVTPQEWALLADPSRVVADGEPVVMFFDGSKDRDATALIGCCVSDGHVFTIGVWEPSGRGDEVPTVEIDATVARAFDRWKVLGFFADVQEWQGFVKVTWPDLYGEQLKVKAQPSGKEPQPIAWDMRSHVYDFTMAVETTLAEIRGQQFTHDGDSRLARHVINARTRDGRWGQSIGKESPNSPRKIDAAVCMVGARMVRRLLPAQPKSAGTGRVIVLT